MSRSRKTVDERLSSLQHPYLTIFVIAVLARWACAALLHAIDTTSLIYDDATYHDMAAAAARHDTQSWDAFTRSLYDSTATLLWPLTWAYRVFGAHQLVGRALVGVAGALTAPIVLALALRVLPRRFAWGVAIAVAFFPSQVVFSSVTLKDGVIWPLLASLALLLAVSAGHRGRTLLALQAAAIVPLVLLAHLRNHTLLVASCGVAAAGWLGGVDRWRRGLGFFVVAAATPLALGAGPLGLAVLPSPSSIVEYRQSQSTGRTAIAEPRGESTTVTGPGSTSVSTTSTSTPPPGGAKGVVKNIRHLPLGLVSVMLRPFPWEAGGDEKATMARLENLLWYACLALAAIGVPRAQRRLDNLAFPMLVTVGLVALYALAEGNAGSAFRHRGEVVWSVLLIAGVGVWSLHERRAGRHPAETE